MTRRQVKRLSLGLVFVLLLGGAVLTDGRPAGPRATRAAGLEVIATSLDAPFLVATPPGDPRLFIAEQRGVIKVYKDGAVQSTWFLDIRSKVLSGGLQGMLGMAFHPDYATNRYVYVYYTDLNGDSVVERYQAFSGLPDLVDPSSATQIMLIPQPSFDHNGGYLNFGPDGYLYIAMGDGSLNGDENNLAQDPGSLMGKLLRIDVDSASPYAIPADNPFVGVGGYEEEIWALGLRNPWGVRFDPATGDLWIADVGDLSWEEINFTPASSMGGENYGWRLMQGTHCYNPPVNCNPGGLQLPIYEYPHEPGICSVTGGGVYRGSDIPAFIGHYFLSDYCGGKLWSFRYDGSNLTDFTDWTSEVTEGGTSAGIIVGFGFDRDGEMYMVDRGSGAGTGRILKLIPSTSDAPVPGLGTKTLETAIHPNPSRGQFTLELRSEASGSVRVEIWSVDGRAVWSGDVELGRSGSGTIASDGIAELRTLASGSYLVRARTAAGVSVTEKLQIAR